MRERDEKARAALGSRIREIRRAAGMTCRDAATSTGIALGNYYLLERGVGNPTVVTLVRVARGLGVPVSELLKGVGA
ncbi:hypothetical protein AX769_02450 [Frondihabitans sp. PAMC 28766]|uniref:helix-turn-helix domain-containing protein n=1 Tax=Frondihabitans sp. PAMC 28766 TaxID=1795630 RepID=UPI00078C1222|nr:helix-turn-helix transcriptional regulator [Frondihabitans sp. PAMC 28766]AMM19200.1 hypothetical protein AX769_02450 [Frondihabitans sp. PAMC 28766]